MKAVQDAKVRQAPPPIETETAPTQTKNETTQNSASGSEFVPPSTSGSSEFVSVAEENDQIQQDDEEDDELLPGDWEPTPRTNVTEDKDDLPGDTPSKSPRRNQPRRARASSPANEIPIQDLEQPSPEEISFKSSPQKSGKSPDISAPLIFAGNNSGSVKKSVYDDSPVSDSMPKKNTVRRKRGSMPWENRQSTDITPTAHPNNSTDSSQQAARIGSVTLAEVTLKHKNSPQPVRPRPRTVGPSLADVLKRQHSSPISNGADITPPQSSLEMPSEVPKQLFTKPTPASVTPTNDRIPETSRSIVPQNLPKTAESLDQSQKQCQDDHDRYDNSLFVPQDEEPLFVPPDEDAVVVRSTHPSDSYSFAQEEPHPDAMEPTDAPSKKRKDDMLESEQKSKRIKTINIRYNMTQDDPVREDPTRDLQRQRQSFMKAAVWKSILEPTESPVVPSTEAVGVMQQMPPLSNPNTPAIASPALTFSRRASSKQQTPLGSGIESGSRTPDQTLTRESIEDIYQEFNEAYQYKGDQERFYHVCRVLANSDSMCPEFLYDDMIMQNADEYVQHVDGQARRCGEILTFKNWAGRFIKGQKYQKGIMTRERVERVVTWSLD
jgi:hypothetical protein